MNGKGDEISNHDILHVSSKLQSMSSSDSESAPTRFTIDEEVK
jgi:hypothetical protein